VRAERGRAKKLVVAFHFQFAQQTAWKCDDCRKSGLEHKRRCGWLPEAERGARRVVWARRQTAVEECPRSHITANSEALLEGFHAFRVFGGAEPHAMPARLVDAICILEQELRSEQSGEPQVR
jgi:hypothetical protein